MKKMLKIVGALVALIVIVLLALPMFVSADYLKSQLVQQVKAATGRDLVIKGNASLKVFPNIVVSVEDVTLGNPQGFTTPYFVSLKKLETGAALGPLLHKELRITGITLVGATLNMEQNAAGAKNWEFQSAPTKAEPQPKQEPSASSPMKALAIGDIKLEDSAVTMIKPGAKSMVAKEINLTVSGADGSSALKVDGSVNYQGEKVSVKVGADKMRDLINGKSSPVEVSLDLPSAKVNFKGTVSNDKELMSNGAVDADIADLPKLLAWATGQPATGGLPKKVSLKSKLATKGTDNVALADMTFSADALTTTGKFAANFAGVPNMKGTLQVKELDLDKLTSKTGQAKAAPSAAKTEGWSDEKLDLSALRSVNANLDLTIGKLIADKAEVTNISANLALLNGAAKVTLNSATLYQGTAKGVVSADANGNAIGANVTLAGIQIEPLMTALSGTSRLSGTTNMNLAVAGAGASERAIVNSLNGNAALKVTDGALKGINIASFVRDAKKGFMGDSSSEKTDFSELSATFKIAQGIVSNDDLTMKSPVLRVGGKGTVSLPARTVNYRLEPTLVASLKGQGGKDKDGLTIPLVISGPWTGPSITPDLAGMLQEGLKDPAKLKENLKDLKGTLKDYNSPKDIGKALFGGKTAAQPAATPDAATAPAGTAAPATTTAPAEGSTAEPAPAPQKKSDAAKEAIGGLLNSLSKKQQ